MEEFIAEFTRAVVAASEVDSFAAVGQLLHEWRATAAVRSDRELAARLSAELRSEGPGPGVLGGVGERSHGVGADHVEPPTS